MNAFVGRKIAATSVSSLERARPTGWSVSVELDSSVYL